MILTNTEIKDLLTQKAQDAIEEKIVRKKKVFRGGKRKKINKASDEAGKTKITGRGAGKRRQQGIKSAIGKRKHGGVKKKSINKAKRSTKKGNRTIAGRGN
jgi:hypothetical protein